MQDSLVLSAKSDPRTFKRFLTGAATVFLLIIGAIVSIRLGAVDVSVLDIYAVLKGNMDNDNYHIIWNIRLPRIIVGILAGINLALSGAILQGILRNPLADPGIIGISAGAGLAAVGIMILFPEQSAFVPAGAFAGSILASLIVYFISWKKGLHPLRLILAGVAVSAFFGAMITVIMVFHSDKVQGTINWLAGGFQGRSWGQAQMILPYTIVGIIGAMASRRYLNILMLGDEVAKGLGIKVEAARLSLLALASLLASSAVSVAGLLGFVGLITPHMIRLIIGSDHRYLLPFSAAAGAVLIVYADTAARMIFSPVEIPAGVLMAFLGAPFFLYLLRGNLKR